MWNFQVDLKIEACQSGSCLSIYLLTDQPLCCLWTLHPLYLLYGHNVVAMRWPDDCFKWEILILFNLHSKDCLLSAQYEAFSLNPTGSGAPQ